MKLSIFTTVTNPKDRGDTWKQAFECYKDLADELVVIDGTEGFNHGFLHDDYKVIPYQWNQEFEWSFIGEQFQRGYEACTGDFVIHADLDFIFHEQDFEDIRLACLNHSDKPAFSMLKRQFILPDRFNIKSRLVVAVNKGKFGDRIRFDSGGDLCQPSLDGKYLSPDDVPNLKIPIWNYEKILKTKAQIMDDVGRMERAYKKHFGATQYDSDGTDQDAYYKWVVAQRGKLNKPTEKVKLTDHPIYMQETIKNLTPNQWGYSGFGIRENDYV